MLDDDPLWYKDAVIYEVHVRAFHDSVGDGVGDFRGLTAKLDYLEDLGVTAVWLLPFYPSPLKDDGYDIADYTNIHPQYGSLRDFREFLDAAHRRGIRVITELVINHTSDQHPWFRRARLAPPGSPERDFYVWSDTPDRYREARIIFKDFERSNWTWDPVAKAYYWHRFYSHQPDLNYDNPAVWQAIFPVLDFWMGMGVDGMRLDAVPYLYEREGTNCENLPETHAFLQALRAHVDSRWPNRMLLAEANQWPEDAVAYFGTGNECHMAFHFPVMPRLFMAVHREDAFPIHDILAQTPPIPETCQWCMFLRNHDELTLEMVTDEERDYMYRAYTRDPQARINLGIRHRLAPLLGNDRRRVELMNGLLLSLPGTPVLYYGDEIGMGDNIYLGDRNGVRTPMQWNGDRNAGFSRANPQRVYLPVIIDPEYHYEAVNVEAQQNNPHSLLWWMKRLIALRKRFKAFGRGALHFLKPANPKVLAFLRVYPPNQPAPPGGGGQGGEIILVVANLSRFVQHVELDLHEYRGLVPEELFGRSLFPPVGDAPYPLTLGPHGFYWFALGAPRVGRGGPAREAGRELPVLRVTRGWGEVFDNSNRDRLEALLPTYLARRQPGGRLTPQEVRAARVVDVRPFPMGTEDAYLAGVRVEFDAGLPETLLVPLTLVTEGEELRLIDPVEAAGLVRVAGPESGVVCDALVDPVFCGAVLRAIVRGETFPAGAGELAGTLVAGAEPPEVPTDGPPPALVRGEQSNTLVVYGGRLILKVFWRIEDGVNPDLEVGRYLTERQRFPGAPPLVGALEYRRRRGEPLTLAVLHRYVPNQGDAWRLALDHLSSFFEEVATQARDRAAPRPVPLLGPADPDAADALVGLLGPFFDHVRLLGQRTAELHRALAADPDDPAFAPEPFTKLYQRSLYQSLRNLTGHVCDALARQAGELPETARGPVERLLARREAILDRFRAALDRPLGGQRIRCHGNYHLGKLLFTGKDFVIIDFEGDPARPLGERRVKRSPLRDVARLVRSLHHAAETALYGKGRTPGRVREEDRALLAPWATAWQHRVAREFIAAYCEHAAPAGLLPQAPAAQSLLLDVMLLEQALQEVERALSFWPGEVDQALAGLFRHLGDERVSGEPGAQATGTPAGR